MPPALFGSKVQQFFLNAPPSPMALPAMPVASSNESLGDVFEKTSEAKRSLAALKARTGSKTNMLEIEEGKENVAQNVSGLLSNLSLY